MFRFAQASPFTPRGRAVWGMVLGALAFVSGCGGAPEGILSDSAEALEARLEERFTPGLHTLMVTLGHRHASLWFSGDEANWRLADYMIHELEELVEEIETLHPVYDDIPVAEMLAEMTTPAIELIEAALALEDRAQFVQAYDQLTVACNACHVASGRDFIVVVRPTSPPFTNLRYRP